MRVEVTVKKIIVDDGKFKTDPKRFRTLNEYNWSVQRRLDSRREERIQIKGE